MNDFADVIAALTKARTIGLISHERPDGDALGSTLGLALSLQAASKSVHAWNQDGISRRYTFLPGTEMLVRTPEAPVAVDLVVALDCATPERLGKTFASWSRPVDLNLDHHVSNTRYAPLNLVRPDYPSTANLVLSLIEQASLPLDAPIATNLFVGISTDTGSFRYRGTTADTFRAAARMAEAGADPAEISRLCYQTISPERFQLERLFLEKAEFDCDGRLAVGFLEPAMFAASGALPEENEGLVERLLEVAPVTVSALFETRGPDTLKVSLRSKGALDVSAFAARFGGGGHPGAAGINLCGDPASHTEKIRTALRKAVAALPSG